MARARAQRRHGAAPGGGGPRRDARAPAWRTGTVKTEVVDGKTRVTYGVQDGDCLWAIAQRFNVTVEQLQTWNALGKSARKGLQVGTMLTVWPGPAAAPIEVQPAAVVAKVDAPATVVRPATPVPPCPRPRPVASRASTRSPRARRCGAWPSSTA